MIVVTKTRTQSVEHSIEKIHDRKTSSKVTRYSFKLYYVARRFEAAHFEHVLP